MSELRKFIRETLETAPSSKLAPWHPAMQNRIKAANADFMKSFTKEFFFYLTEEIPQYYLDQVGLKIILDFIAVEDGMNFRLQAGLSVPGTKTFTNKQDPRQESESEIDYILRINKIPYTWKELKDRLVQYFIRRLLANVPEDREFKTIEDVEKFIKMYEQKFLHGYMLPMAKMAS